MNHFVPDFEMDEDDSSIPSSTAGISRTHTTKSNMPEEDELMELLWQNGQVVLHSQTQRNSNSKKPSPLSKFPILDTGESTAKNHHSNSNSNQPPQASASTTLNTEEPPYQVFMQEDEMASWLHYPLEEEDNFCSDLLYPTPSAHYTHSRPESTRPPVPPGRRTTEFTAPPEPSSNFHNFMRLSSTRQNDKAESRPLIFDKAVKESTVVESSVTPSVRLTPSNGFETVAEHEREMTTLENTVTSSSGGSGESAAAVVERLTKVTSNDNDRKRKARQHDDDEDTKCEASDTKKQARGSTSTRRSRAAEVHNLSERRRRDRINEKMKALQELIPRCNKSDKASMLDEAIEYLKSLQLQVQMMSMGCGMVPMMFPGVQPYMSPMGMGMGMGMGIGMGMGMDMSMNRPMMPFPQVLAQNSMPRPSTAAATQPHLAPRLPMPPYNLPSGSSPNVMAMRPNYADPSPVPIALRNPNPSQIPFTDSYRRYLGHYNMQPPPSCPPQSQAGTSKGVETHEKLS